MNAGAWSQVHSTIERATVRGSTVIGVRLGDETRLWQRGELPDGLGSIFEIGSITKVFTSTLLADLVRRGVVAFDDPVAAHVPVAPPVVTRAITLEDLATHRSGLPRLPKGVALRGMTTEHRDPYASFDEERMLRAIVETSPKSPPGENVVYSNYGAGLLGFALARAAGTSFAGLVQEHITRPLGMDDTGVELAPGSEARLTPGRTWWGRPAGRWNMAELVAAGGVTSTASDLLEFLRLHSPDSDSSLAAVAAETARPRADVSPGVGMGLGWLVLSANNGPPKARLGREVLMHDGGTGGYRSFVGVTPETGAAVVVLSARARNVSGLGVELLRAIV